MEVATINLGLLVPKAQGVGTQSKEAPAWSGNQVSITIRGLVVGGFPGTELSDMLARVLLQRKEGRGSS